MGLFSAKKKEKTPKTVQVKGIPLQCPICKNQYFWKKKAQLNTALKTLFNLGWANKEATCFVCSECTHILWFDP